jgi:hypothetical protein
VFLNTSFKEQFEAFTKGSGVNINVGGHWEVGRSNLDANVVE